MLFHRNAPVRPGNRSKNRLSRGLALALVVLMSAAGVLWSIGTGRRQDGPELSRPDGRNAGNGIPVSIHPSKDQPVSRDLVSGVNLNTGDMDFPPSYPAWPQGLSNGETAKRLLLETLTRLNESFSKIPAYTATFRKQERLKGKLLGEQAFSIKVRQDPFAVYFKATSPASGKEVIFAKGYFDDKVIAHSAGLSRLIVPRLQVPPEHPLIRSESRHPITNAGIGNLIRNLIGYRERDLGQSEAETTLDHWTAPDGRHWLRSVHVHHAQTADRPFNRVEVLYHPETRLPLRFTGYDWPDPRSGTGDSPILGERYCYDDLTLNAPLAASDFDPANPDYQFHRF